MLREMRNQDPRLKRFQEILTTPQDGSKPYSPHTVKSYKWHAGAFLDWCDEQDINPNKIQQKQIRAYLEKVHKEVSQNEKSYPFFLQACTTLEIYYRSIMNGLKAQQFGSLVRRIRKQLTA